MAVAQLTHAQPDPADPEAPEVAHLADLLPADQTQLLYSLCLHGRTELGLAPDEYAALLMVLLRLLAFQPAGQRALAEKKSLTRASEPAPPPPAPVAEVVAVPVVPPVPVALQPVPVRHAPPPMATVPVVDAPPRVQVASPVQDRPEKIEPKVHPALGGIESVATPVVSVPVRVAPEPVRPELAPPVKVALPVDATAEGDFWHTLVMAMVQAETVGALVRELALQSQLLARDDTAEPSHWLLRVENATLNQPGTRDRLQAALAPHGHTVKLAVEVGTVSDTPARRQAAAAAQRQEEAERSIRQDPYVLGLMRDFGGRIVPGTLKPVAPAP
jgi:DNA polymerase III subunit gamma/tau